MRYGLAAAAGLAVMLGAGSAWAQGDPAAGKTSFNKCAVCHQVTPGVNRVGPSLHGVVGRHSGQVENYNYSAANKAADVTWDRATLDKYLIDPRAFMPGTKMIFPGLKNETERNNVIAYLETLK